MLRRAVAFMVVVLGGCARAPQPAPAASPQAAYVDSRTCSGCHAEIAKTYARTAMAQAFYRATPEAMKGIPGRYEHAASGRTYEILERNGKYFERRTEKGRYELEREIHYVMGSGRNARSFLHRTPQGRLTELPLGWYAENGGRLAMSPGYDRADPLDFRRKVSFDCMFCHNAYPSMPPGEDRPSHEPVFPAALPEGIDCQRCHGPGSLHVAAAGKGGIVNPKKLGAERAMEVCMQCHLETTSRPLPNSLVRFGRGAFSYRPGEPLEDFVLHFDHAKGTGREEKFEIVNSVYRLRQSKCFTESAGKLGCTTCHNPHDVKRGAEGRVLYAKACQGCHQEMSAKAGHPKAADCASCHMPRRRTEDVVHAVMTDHRIVRRPPPGNLLAPRAETHEARFDGAVELYYPAQARDAEVYLAVAQVVQKSNLKGGIARLEALPPAREPRVPLALGQAYEATGRTESALAKYREALALDGAFAPAMRSLGELLQRTGRGGEAVPILEKARVLAPRDASVLYALGLAYRDARRGAEAIAAMEAATAEDADFPAAHNSLGGLYFERGDRVRAEASLREALRHQPDFGEAHSNLGQVLAAAENYKDAEFHLREAIRRGAPSAWRALGDVQAVQGNWAGAKLSYGEALRAQSDDAATLLGLGTAQAALGEMGVARANLQKAAARGDGPIRAEAMDLLGKIR